jgi:hemoglobin
LAETVFVRYGGFASVSRVVSDFYGRVMESSIMRPYFENVDMERLIDHQTKFFASMMGGPASFSDEHLLRVHSHLGIDDEAFQELALLLRETLEDHDFDESDISLVIGEVVARRPVIVSRA